MTHPYTTSLEHSKKLADACQKMGVEMPEVAYYWWKKAFDTEYTLITIEQKRQYEVLRWVQEFIPNLQLSELMRMLPEVLDGFNLRLDKPSSEWAAGYEHNNVWEYQEEDSMPENAACELLTELILSGKVKELTL